MAATLVAGAGVLDLQSRATLTRLRLEQSNGRQARQLKQLRAGSHQMPSAPASAETLAFVSLADGATAADLEAEGMQVMTVIGNIVIVNIPLADAERMAACDAVRTMSLSRDVKPCMDLARKSAGVDVAQAGGDGLPKAYTGAGVFTAIVDQGVDPHHINFLDADGNNRIEYLSHITMNFMGTGLAEKFYGNPADIKDARPLSDFTTDAPDQFHGTHTLGIMAGGYAGKVEVTEGLNGNLPNVVEKAGNPYSGVATGSRIGVSCGILNDAGIAYGMDYLLGYSVDYKNLPTVMNISLGSNIGSHDTRSQMSQVLDVLGQKGIICVAAGNEGDMKVALSKTFTADNKMARSFLYPYAYRYDPDVEQDGEMNTAIRYGQAVVYSNDETPFQLQAVIYNKARGYRVVKRFTLSNGGSEGVYYCTDADIASSVNGTVIDDKYFAGNFYGYIGGGAMVDQETGRYYAMADIYLFDWNDNRTSGNYVVGIEVVGEEGQRIDCYCDGLTYYFDNMGVEGFDDGSRNGSISDMAVANNIIVVGSYSTRQEWQSLDGTVSSYPGDGFRPGFVTEFSSFGTLADGRNLPTVCAPGSTVISSISSPYLNTLVESMANEFGLELTDEMRREYFDYLCQVRTTGSDGKTYYWKQEPGTSMATPFVAGSIALWLEADPTLTVDDVKDIIAKTATVDDAVRAGDPVQWGAGKFNALAGLKEVIRRSAGIDGVQADGGNDRLIVTAAGNRSFNIFVGGAGALDIALYSAGGARVLSLSADGDEATLDASGVTDGIYVLTVNGHSQKLVVK